MNKAVIIMGRHFSGKSKTIKEYIKQKLELASKNHKRFILNEKEGYVLSQSFEEGDWDVDYMVTKYSKYTYLVLAGRPKEEENSLSQEVEDKLRLKGFTIKIFHVESGKDESFYEDVASKAYDWLRFGN